MIENPRTGERIVFEVRTPELLVVRSTWTRPGRRAAAHVHPAMEERYDVLAGQAAFRIGGIERTAVAGETVVVPPGMSHLAWNPTDGIVELRIMMRPALRWAEFVERLFAGDDPAMLLREYAAELVLPESGRARAEDAVPERRAFRRQGGEGRRD